MKLYNHSLYNPHLFFSGASTEYAMHQHEQIELSYVLHGQASYEIGTTAIPVDPGCGYSHTLSKGQLILLFPYIPHKMTCSPDSDTQVLTILFNPDFAEDFRKRFCEYHMPQYIFRKKELHPGTISALSWLADCAVLEAESHMDISGFCATNLATPSGLPIIKVRGWLTAVLGDLFFKHEIILRNQPLKQDLLHDILDHMQSHTSEALTLDLLCRQLGISRQFFSHDLKKQIYINYFSLYNSFRLQHAQELLRYTNLSMIVIALECGFTNAQSLTRNFKQAAGLTPTQFREQFSQLEV